MATHRITAGSTLGGMVEQVSFFLPPGTVMEQEPAAPRIHRQKLLEAFVIQLKKDRLLIYCAGKGYGATSIAHEVARAISNSVKPPLFIRCDNMPSYVVREALASLVELKDSQDSYPFEVLCVEGITRLDTEDAQAISAYLQRLTSKTHVIMRMDIASLAALETVGQYSCIQAYDLLASIEEVQQWFHDSSIRLTLKSMESLTGNIASLLEGLASDGVWFNRGTDSSAYESVRSMLLYNAVSDGLIKEDRKLRAAMVLLGEGTFEELRLLGVRVDDELIRCAYQEVPILGVDSSFTAFRIVGGPYIPPALAQRIGEEFPKLVKEALQQLTKNQRLKQVVSIAHPCRQWLDLKLLAETMPLELWNATGSDILREVLYEADKQEEELSAGLTQARAIFQLCSGVIDARSPKLREVIRLSDGSVGGALASLERSLSLYRQWPEPDTSALIEDENKDRSAQSGRICRSRSKAKKASTVQALEDQLEQHCLFREQLLLGEWRSAAEARFWAMSSQASETVGGSLLVVDAYCACGLLGEGVTLDLKTELARALKTLRTHPRERLGLHENALCWFVEVAQGKQRDCSLIQESWAMADESHDEVMLNLLSLGAGLVHLQEGAFAQAEAMLKPLLSASLPQWMGQARDLGLALVALSNHEALSYLSCVEGDSPTTPMGALTKVVATLFYKTREPLERRLEHKQRLGQCRPDALSVLFVDLLLSFDFQGAALKDLLPKSWRKAAEDRRKLRKALVVASIQEKSTEAVASSGTTVSIHVLGGLQIRVDGKLVPKKQWRRTSASSLLECLALLESHMAYRYELFAWLWPDKTVEKARQALYSAVSAARKALGAIGADKSLLVHQNGLVSLDTQQVSYDIDRLRRHIDSALGARSASVCATEALRASRLYSGGLFVPPIGAASDFFAHEHDALEQRYLDALVRGAHRAREIQHPRDSLQLSRAAFALAPCREDACTELVRALMDMRRFSEAEEVCREFRVEMRRRYRQSPGATMNALTNELVRLRSMEAGEGWAQPAGRKWELDYLEEEALEKANEASLAARDKEGTID
ncbi:MAG: hypothetical protein HFJ63_08370 [Atopobiaceae bacterium]|nr:hypothetical protein [Atopobiaceae bacterium]